MYGNQTITLLRGHSCSAVAEGRRAALAEKGGNGWYFPMDRVVRLLGNLPTYIAICDLSTEAPRGDASACRGNSINALSAVTKISSMYLP